MYNLSMFANPNLESLIPTWLLEHMDKTARESLAWLDSALTANLRILATPLGPAEPERLFQIMPPLQSYTDLVCAPLCRVFASERSLLGAAPTYDRMQDFWQLARWGLKRGLRDWVTSGCAGDGTNTHARNNARAILRAHARPNTDSD